jgi:D-galactarolactone cycloisomerase
MRIRDIEVIGLVGATPEGGWSNELKPEDSVHTLVIVHTDEGIDGLGGAFTNAGLVRAAVNVMESLWRGESAIEPERVSEKLHQNTFWLGRGGSLTHAISAIDIALWDILGKATGQPVGRLLGGRYRDRVKPYASVLMDHPGPLRELMTRLREEGYKAVKIDLMVDAGGSDAFWPNGYAWALRTSKMLADYDVVWFEEALKPDALEDFVALRRNASVPISGGEVLTRRQTFVPWLAAGAFDIVQPDVCKVGGISEERRIGWYAEEFGVKLIPHGWNTAVGLAADLQLASALPGTDRVEYLQGSPYIDEIITQPWQLDADGYLTIPDAPGLGIELDWDVLPKYSDTAS